MTVPTVANLSLGCADWTALDLTTRTSTNTKLNEILRVFSEIEDTPESIILLFFSPKMLLRLFILKEIKTSHDSKMIKLLTLDNLFPPLRNSR